MEPVRKAVQKGRFYPAEPNDIVKMIDHWERILAQAGKDDKKYIPEMIVAPHAGYIFSGFTANTAFRFMPEKNPETVVVIGPSHYEYIPGVSAGPFRWYETPFGFMPGDLSLLSELNKHFELVFHPPAHAREHSTEVEFPFTAYYTPDAKILELIYGDVSTDYLKEIIKFLLALPGVAVVISTDLSHYYPQEKANSLDAYCVEGTQLEDSRHIMQGCEACGKPGLVAAVDAAREKDLKAQVLDYRTSGDVTGEYSSVVGYMSAVFYK